MTHVTPYPTRWRTDRMEYLRQFSYFKELYDRIRDIRGDIVECGLGLGDTFAMLAFLAGSEQTRHDRILRGFDSFAGWPEPSSFDRSWRDPKQGEWCVSRALFDELLEKSGVTQSFPDLSIEITEGFLRDTLPHEAGRGYSIAFLHLDVDLYDGYTDSLRYLFPLVAKGGIVCFDEYREFSSKHPDEEKWPGATKAIDEYLGARSSELVRHSQSGKYYIVK